MNAGFALSFQNDDAQLSSNEDLCIWYNNIKREHNMKGQMISNMHPCVFVCC